MKARMIKVTNLNTGISEVKDLWSVHAEIVKKAPAYQLLIQTQKKLTINGTQYERVQG